MWMRASQLPLLGVQFSVPAAQAQPKLVGTGLSAAILSPRAHLPTMADTWPQVWLFPCFQMISSHWKREVSIFPEDNKWEMFTLGQKEKNKQGLGPRTQSSLPDPFDWQLIHSDEWGTALVQGDKRQDLRRLCVYKHIAKSVTDIIAKHQ